MYVVATPIGNLEDITLRALRILKEVDLIACEDTRHTRGLLTHYDIHKPLESYHEHNEMYKSGKLADLLLQGKNIALVSDAGTPGISDPGYRLTKLCAEKNIKIVPVPGPVAFIAALSASGLPTDAFSFYGFVPPRSSRRRKFLEEIKGERPTLVFYESPYRLLDSLQDMLDILGDRRAVVARQMTKLHEEFLRGTISQILSLMKEKPVIKGEFTILVGGPC